MVQATVVVMSCTALALVTPDVLEPTVAPAFVDAGQNLWDGLILGFLFLGLYYIPMNWLTLTAGAHEPRLDPSHMLCAGTNLGLLYLWVPAYGLILRSDCLGHGLSPRAVCSHDPSSRTT